MKPKILIVASEGFAWNRACFMVNTAYGKAIADAGGLPLVALSPRLADEYLTIADGLLLTDGPEVHRSRYGKYYSPTETAVPMCQEREEMELRLCEIFAKAKKPILGIGRGMEIINVFFGGTLCDDMKESANHIQTDGNKIDFVQHPIHMHSNTYMVNSAHKSCVESLGDNLIAVAHAEDGTIEAICHDTLSVSGVMWHPEHESHNDGISTSVFDRFITDCKEVRR